MGAPTYSSVVNSSNTSTHITELDSGFLVLPIAGVDKKSDRSASATPCSASLCFEHGLLGDLLCSSFCLIVSAQLCEFIIGFLWEDGQWKIVFYWWLLTVLVSFHKTDSNLSPSKIRSSETTFLGSITKHYLIFILISILSVHLERVRNGLSHPTVFLTVRSTESSIRLVTKGRIKDGDLL